MNTRDATAHLIAHHLRAIVRLMTDEPEPLQQVTQSLGFDPIDTANLDMLAQLLEASAPFTPLTDEEKGEVINFIAETEADYSMRERIENATGDWTEADWRIEFDELQDYASQEE